MFSVHNDLVQLRIIQRLRAFEFERDIAVKIITRPAEKFSKRNTRLKTELVALDRHEDFAPNAFGVCGNQTVDVIRGPLDLRRLSSARLLFEIMPPFQRSLNLLVRSAGFRQRHWRFRDRMRFGYPIATIEKRRVAMQSPIHTRETSNRQHDCKHDQDKAASRETTQAFPFWRRLDPGVHQRERFVTSLQRYTVTLVLL